MNLSFFLLEEKDKLRGLFLTSDNGFLSYFLMRREGGEGEVLLMKSLMCL